MNQQDKDAIEKRAWDLQVEFWDHCVSDTTARPDPFCVTDPGLLANFLGIQHIELPEIRNDFQSKNHSEIGGAFDRQQNLIATSLKFSNKVRRFTLAHEIAHSILHTEQAMFRDRVIVKSGVSAVESSGGLIDCCHLNTVFEFHSRYDLGQVIKPS